MWLLPNMKVPLLVSQKYSRVMRVQARIDGIRFSAELLQNDILKQVAIKYADTAKGADHLVIARAPSFNF